MLLSKQDFETDLYIQDPAEHHSKLWSTQLEMPLYNSYCMLNFKTYFFFSSRALNEKNKFPLHS